MSKKDEETYQEAKKQDELSRKLDPAPREMETKPESMAVLEGLLASRNQ